MPDLGEEGHPHDRLHAPAAGTAQEADSCIPTTGVDETLAKSRTEHVKINMASSWLFVTILENSWCVDVSDGVASDC